MASALPTSADAARVLYHEVLGHHGLRGHFGKDLDRVLDQVIKLRRKDVQAKAQEYGLDMSNPEHAGYAAEEVLAELAQSRPDLGFVQRAIAAIRNFLRTHVPGFKVLELTDADIARIVTEMSEESAQSLAYALRDTAITRGGHDNISAVIMTIGHKQ